MRFESLGTVLIGTEEGYIGYSGESKRFLGRMNGSLEE